VNPAGKKAWWQLAGLDPADLYGADLKDDAAAAAAAFAAAKGVPAPNLTDFRMRDPLGHGVPNTATLPTRKGQQHAYR
jgi:hypothetical protein